MGKMTISASAWGCTSTREALIEAVGAASSGVTARDARSVFEHCEYNLPI